MIYRIIFILAFTIAQVQFAIGQINHKITKEDYIKSYSDIAVKEMNRVGIPASITLAQGIHESDCGNSKLSVEGNNHFGIKCHASWNGEKIYKDDDQKDECFRKYKSAYESYRDHSDFLKNTKRYASLFDLSVTDYKAWANGLKNACYATNPKYATLIISIIEDNNLSRYDKGFTAFSQYKGNTTNAKISVKKTHEVNKHNRVPYIIVRKGDTFFKISEEFKFTIRFLHKCNDMNENDELKEGQIFYIDKKRNKAEKGIDFHIVKTGETMQAIAQQYGVKLKKLYKKNRMSQGGIVSPGEKLWLRKKKNQ